MKKISEHLGQIIVALAGVALLVAAVVVFKAPIGEFYNSMIGKETSVADTVLSGLDDINLSDLSGGGSSNGPTILDGAEQAFDKEAATPLVFRSSAPISEFQEVKVDGETVDPPNYAVTEGSTIVTFTEEYSAALANGAHTIEIVSTSGTATTSFTVVGATKDPALHPDDGTDPQTGDTYTHGDYLYTYNYNGWEVALNTAVTDKNQTSYGPILESINGKPVNFVSNTFSGCTNLVTAPQIPSSVTFMESTFKGCTSLTTAPKIPSGVKNLNSTFLGCTSLETAPVIPEGVTVLQHTFNGCTNLTTAPAIPDSVLNLFSTFSGCTSLETAPVIPAGVTNMSSTFYNCTSLAGTIIVNSSSTEYYNFFNGTTEAITLTTNEGCAVLFDIAATANNDNVTVAIFEGDYKYSYSSSANGWVVEVSDKTKSSYGSISSELLGKPVTSLANTFSGCTNLTTAPAIPESVTTMEGAFADCSSLATAPAIPSGVKTLKGTFTNCASLTDLSGLTIPSKVTSLIDAFSGCTSLTTAPVIPSTVTNTQRAFQGCIELTGTITINSNPRAAAMCAGCFADTVKPIVLTGTSTKLANFAATATNGNVTVAE